MSKMRKIDRIFQAKPTLEGAGVHLKWVFGHADQRTGGLVRSDRDEHRRGVEAGFIHLIFSLSVKTSLV